jgi:hypothetical protein
MKKKELEQVVAELAVRLGQAETREAKLREEFDQFIELDRKWSKKVADGLTAALNMTKELSEELPLIKAVSVGVGKSLGMTEDDFTTVLAEAHEVTTLIDKLCIEESDLKDVMDNEEFRDALKRVMDRVDEEVENNVQH